MNRSATSPMPRLRRPPSIELPLNMDCAFPPFPTSENGIGTSGKSKSRERLEPNYQHKYATPDPLYAPLSPRTNGGAAVAKRMDTIAPGPFDRRPSTSDGRRTPAQKAPELGHRRTATQSSTKSNGYAPDRRTSSTSNNSRNSTLSNKSVGLPTRPKPRSDAVVEDAPPLPLPKAEGIDAFLDRLQKETMQPSTIGQDSRSRTFPLRQESRDAIGASPERGMPSKSGELSRRPTDIESLGSNARANNIFPSRSASRAGLKLDVRADETSLLPPMPNYRKDLPSNPLHTPSDSGLSDDSISSGGFRSATSSRSSPPASEASGQHSRNVSKMGRSDYMNDDPIPRSESPESFMDPRTPPQPGRRRDLMGYDRGKAPEPLLQPPPKLTSDAPAPESPMDPAIQLGILYQAPPSGPISMNRDDPALNLGQSPSRRAPESPPRDRPNRRPTMARRGNCRGCSEPIVGKSVKDSSGRLTGRYHRACFTCKTCSDPFPSAEFYVFDNSPYCEQHYHELNGSLCRSCNRGIEGQYLETDQRQKFHPRCFTCLTCRVVLRDDYYEVNGKNYCDRHAYAAQKSMTSLAPGDMRSRNNLQKRRTRLMMMM